jgi:hypothetical protein
MSQEYDGARRGFPMPSAGLALSAFARVKIAAGVLALAGAADWATEVGTVTEAQFTTGLNVGAPATVRLRGDRGTRKMIAAGAISAGVAIYAAASGQITATPSGPQIGESLEAASGAGSIIECLYDPPFALRFVDLTDVSALTPVQGDVPYIGAGGVLALLAPGTSGTKLTTEGAAANPIFS